MTTDNDRVKAVYLTGPALEQLDAYAQKNNLTRSGALAEVVRAVADGMPVPAERQRVGKRVSLWTDPKVWLKFQRHAKKHGVTQGQAIMAALEQLT
jgi:hypothetical protein